MKNKGIWILLGSVVLLSLYTYFGEYQGKENEKTKQEQQSIVFKDFKADQVNAIEVADIAQTVRLERSSDGWKITEPISDSADNSVIEEWVKQLIEEKTMSVAVEGADIQWKYFGFDQPVKSLTLKTTSNQQKTIQVSAKKNFEGNSFIRIPGENKVMVAGPAWIDHSEKKLFDVRNRNIFRHQISNVQAITIKNKKSSIDIENKDARWVASKQPELALDQNGIREMITKTNEIKAIEFVGERETVVSAKKKLNLGNGTPTLSMHIKLSQGEWAAHFYQTADKNVYAEIPELRLLVKIPNDSFDRFSGLTLADLRDFKLPFAAFDRSKVEKFSYETSLKHTNMVKKGASWELDPADSANEVQQDKVHALLEVLKNLVAKQYITKTEVKKNFSKQRLVFKDSADQIHFELQFSDSETKKVNNEEKSFRYAKTNLYSDAFILDESEFQKLQLNDLTKAKVSNEGKTLPITDKKEEARGQ